MIEQEFKYEEEDIISDTIINYYENCDNKDVLEPFIDKYKNNKKFYEFIQKNCLVNKIDESYLLRLYNDFDEDGIVDEYDYITNVNTTRWI